MRNTEYVATQGGKDHVDPDTVVLHEEGWNTTLDQYIDLEAARRPLNEEFNGFLTPTQKTIIQHLYGFVEPSLNRHRELADGLGVTRSEVEAEEKRALEIIESFLVARDSHRELSDAQALLALFGDDMGAPSHE